MKNIEVIDLKTIKPKFGEDFDINKALKGCHSAINNTCKTNAAENFQNTKTMLWILTHYVEQINSNKTLNLFKKGFDLTKAEIETLIECLYKAKNTITCDLDKSLLIVKLDQANGETPEEANPVGQISISFSKTEIDKLIDVLSIGQKYSKDWEFKMKMVIKLLTGKPLETTKGQPCYCMRDIDVSPEKCCGNF